MLACCVLYPLSLSRAQIRTNFRACSFALVIHMFMRHYTVLLSLLARETFARETSRHWFIPSVAQACRSLSFVATVRFATFRHAEGARFVVFCSSSVTAGPLRARCLCRRRFRIRGRQHGYQQQTKHATTRPMARPIRKPRMIFSPFEPPLAMPINFSRNRSSANAFEGTMLPVAPAVEESSLSGDEPWSPRGTRCHVDNIGMMPEGGCQTSAKDDGGKIE